MEATATTMLMLMTQQTNILFINKYLRLRISIRLLNKYSRTLDHQHEFQINNPNEFNLETKQKSCCRGVVCSETKLWEVNVSTSSKK